MHARNINSTIAPTKTGGSDHITASIQPSATYIHRTTATSLATMAITIVPATVDDAPELTRVGMLGFQDDLLNRTILPLHEATPAQLSEHLQWRVARARDRMTGPGKFYVKAVDSETGAIVGSCGIQSPEVVAKNARDGIEVSGSEVADGDEKPKKLELPSIVKVELQERLDGVMKEAQREILGQREDVWSRFSSVIVFFAHEVRETKIHLIEIPTMVVHPDYQRRGIAKRLLLAVCAHADKAGQDVYLEASPAGKKLYLSNGFEEKRADDLGKLVGAEEYFPLTYMLRPFRPEYAVAGTEANGHAG